MNSTYGLFLFPAFFALFSCLALGETSPTPSPEPRSGAETGLEGVITVSPIHGGPVREGQATSGPLAKTAFIVRQDERTVAEFETDEQGRFRVLLPPGRYIVEGKQPKRRFGNYGPKPVAIMAGEMTQVEWNFDTGMR